jgi:leader peptidase (prepilin peptidase) / N-methyltransferase
VVVGHGLIRWIIRLTGRTENISRPPSFSTGILPRLPLFGGLLVSQRCVYRGENIARAGLLTELTTGLLFAGFTWSMMVPRCQSITEVRPDEIWWYGRILYHLVLLALLITATGTDLRDYMIPDQITFAGIAIAVVGATWSGDLQMVHFWIDAHQEVPGIQAAYIPEWIGQHPHWHGLVVSLTGLVAGAGLTWLVRFISSFFLGQEAMGLGDITLMAMIGAFLGWQPVLVVFLLAPFCGLIVAISARAITGQTFISYGPYLCAATVMVMFGWKWIWPLEIHLGGNEIISVRKIFSDVTGLAILMGIAMTALAVLSGLLRVYRNIPVTRPNRETPDSSTKEE